MAHSGSAAVRLASAGTVAGGAISASGVGSRWLTGAPVATFTATSVGSPGYCAEKSAFCSGVIAASPSG